MGIATGDQIPPIQLRIMTDDGPEIVIAEEYFTNSKVVLFSVPGAFTPTPGYVAHADDFIEKGIDRIACVSVNDVFVMDAWGKSAGADKIDMLADGNGDFAAALGLELDATAFGMGMRSQRFALVAVDGKVTHLFVEAPGEFKVSAAEYVLSQI
jgi:peroxiredoxin